MESTSSPVTLITGARKGIGRYLAEHYVGQGHHVIGCSRGKPEYSHPHYRHFEADVADETAVVAMFKEIRALHAAIKHDLPHTPDGLLETWRVIVPILRRQQIDPTYEYVPVLPSSAQMPGAAA